AEQDVISANNTDSETTATVQNCTSRPPVKVQATAGAPGSHLLNVVLTAQTSAGVPTNAISQLRFQSTANSTVDVLGQNGRSGAFTVNTSGSPASVSLVVHFTA